MSVAGDDYIPYRRSRFRTRLPLNRLYTPGHYWLLEESPGCWRVGFTKFATRMLGDLVDHELFVAPGAPVTVGQEIGSIEGFKALTTLFSAAEGEFLGIGDALVSNITAVESDPYEKGWLYRVKGRPDPGSIDVHAYMALLDGTIDRLLHSRHDETD